MRGIRLAGVLLAVLALAAQVSPADSHLVTVATDGTNDLADDADIGLLAGPLGIDVIELQLGSTGTALEFVIKLASLDAPPPGEVIRYLWQFRVDDVEYWVQAKMSDVASGTTFVDDPAGAVTHLQGAFVCAVTAEPWLPFRPVSTSSGSTVSSTSRTTRCV